MDRKLIAKELLKLSKSLIAATSDGKDLTNGEVNEVKSIFQELKKICDKYGHEAEKFDNAQYIRSQWGTTGAMIDSLLHQVTQLGKDLNKI